MSSPTSPKKTSPGADVAAPLHPISLLDTPTSQPIALARPALYLALLALRFNSLVEDPVAELKYAAVVVGAGQVVYAVTCLPINGSEKAKAPAKKRPGERKKVESVNGPRAIPSVILSFVLSLLATPFIYALFILFGAPFLASTPQTVLLSVHFALLALLPILYTRGLTHHSLLALAGCTAPLDETFGGLLGCALGAWLGAVPIPLDWDREWQKWPVTVLVGMYLGGCLGSLVGGWLVHGKRVFVESEVKEVKKIE